jgi:hypothetical protein
VDSGVEAFLGSVLTSQNQYPFLVAPHNPKIMHFLHNIAPDIKIPDCHWFLHFPNPEFSDARSLPEHGLFQARESRK